MGGEARVMDATWRLLHQEATPHGKFRRALPFVRKDSYGQD